MSRPTSQSICPNCQQELADNAVLCVDCGYHLSFGRVLTTVIADDAPPTESRSDNPYLSPLEGSDADPGRPWLAQILSFDGRTTRRFWFASVAVAVGIFVPLQMAAEAGRIGKVFPAAAFCVLLWPMLAIQTQRWHDFDYSGRNVLWWLVPIVGPLYVFVMLATTPGSIGHNNYGPNPR